MLRQRSERSLPDIRLRNKTSSGDKCARTQLATVLRKHERLHRPALGKQMPHEPIINCASNDADNHTGLPTSILIACKTKVLHLSRVRVCFRVAVPALFLDPPLGAVLERKGSYSQLRMRTKQAREEHPFNRHHMASNVQACFGMKREHYLVGPSG